MKTCQQCLDCVGFTICAQDITPEDADICGVFIKNVEALKPVAQQPLNAIALLKRWIGVVGDLDLHSQVNPLLINETNAVIAQQQ